VRGEQSAEVLARTAAVIESIRDTFAQAREQHNRAVVLLHRGLLRSSRSKDDCERDRSLRGEPVAGNDHMPTRPTDIVPI